MQLSFFCCHWFFFPFLDSFQLSQLSFFCCHSSAVSLLLSLLLLTVLPHLYPFNILNICILNICICISSTVRGSSYPIYTHSTWFQQSQLSFCSPWLFSPHPYTFLKFTHWLFLLILTPSLPISKFYSTIAVVFLLLLFVFLTLFLPFSKSYSTTSVVFLLLFLVFLTLSLNRYPSLNPTQQPQLSFFCCSCCLLPRLIWSGKSL